MAFIVSLDYQCFVSCMFAISLNFWQILSIPAFHHFTLQYSTKISHHSTSFASVLSPIYYFLFPPSNLFLYSTNQTNFMPHHLYAWICVPCVRSSHTSLLLLFSTHFALPSFTSYPLARSISLHFTHFSFDFRVFFFSPPASATFGLSIDFCSFHLSHSLHHPSHEIGGMFIQYQCVSCICRMCCYVILLGIRVIVC